MGKPMNRSIAAVVTLWLALAGGAWGQLVPCQGMLVPSCFSAPGTSIPAQLTNMSIDMYFGAGVYWGLNPTGLAVVRNSSGATDLLWTSAAGTNYNSFAANTLRLTPGLGALIEPARTNFLLNSTAPATQTTGTLATGTYTLWINCAATSLACTATMSVGTATGCGAAAAAQYVPISFTIAVSGTCTITLAGVAQAFQLELNPGSISAPSSFIVTAGAIVQRNNDIVTFTANPVYGGSYSMFIAFTPLFPTAYATAQDLAFISDGTFSNFIEYRRVASTGNISSGAFGGSGYSIGSVAAQPGSQFRMVTSIAPGAQAFYANGVLDASTTAATLPVNLGKTVIGSNGVTPVPCGCYVTRFALNPAAAITPTVGQVITTPVY